MNNFIFLEKNVDTYDGIWINIDQIESIEIFRVVYTGVISNISNKEYSLTMKSGACHIISEKQYNKIIELFS